MITARRPLVRAAAVAACAGGVLALPAAAALADDAPAAAPRTLVKSLTLADGVSTAHVYRVAEGAYEADIMNGGTRIAGLGSRDGAPGFGGTDALRVSLQPDGRLSSWLPAQGDGRPADRTAFASQDGRKTAQRTGATVPDTTPDTTPAVAPADASADASADAPLRAAGPAEALRLNTLADRHGDGMLLIAAGGGMAAAGAAGLGFAMLRRGRTET
ncbi:hypothetical protein [Streptomyces sp. NPDC051211]|uniref:hypothetical protein n=1 Tax=Streptomyces sp. NPDC051211 TaxID=3154643 RepID=UPI00344FE720